MAILLLICLNFLCLLYSNQFVKTAIRKSSHSVAVTYLETKGVLMEIPKFVISASRLFLNRLTEPLAACCLQIGQNVRRTVRC